MDGATYVEGLLAILTDPSPKGIDPDDPYGTAVQRRLEAAVAAARAKDPDVTFGWYARPPGSPPER